MASTPVAAKPRSSNSTVAVSRRRPRRSGSGLGIWAGLGLGRRPRHETSLLRQLAVSSTSQAVARQAERRQGRPPGRPVIWSATTWPPWSRPAAPWPPPWPPRPGSADAPAWPEGSVAAEDAAGQGAAAGLGQEHVVGGDHHQLAAGQRAGDLAPDRPAGGVPVDRPELLQGRLLGGVEAVVGGWPWSGLAGRRALARPEPEGGCSAQPPDDIPEEPRGAAGICHWGPPDSVLAGSGPDFEVPDRLGYDPQCQVQMQLPRPSAGGQRPQTIPRRNWR